MPRRGAQPSRQQQAFESLLDQEYAAQTTSAGADTSRGRTKVERRGKQPNRTVVDKRDSGRTSGFALREDLPSDNSGSYPSSAQEQLYSMFGSVLDKDVIDAISVDCNNSVEAAIEKLLTLSERNQSQAPSGSRQPAKPEGACRIAISACTHTGKHYMLGQWMQCRAFIQYSLQAQSLDLATGVGFQKSAKGWC